MSYSGLLNQIITLYPKSSYNAQGREVNGSGTTYKARFEKKTKRKLMDNGQLVLIEATVFVKSDFPATIDDRIDYGTDKYRVFNKYDCIGANGEVHHIELQLIRWRQT
jgi:hypothetical protein